MIAADSEPGPAGLAIASDSLTCRVFKFEVVLGQSAADCGPIQQPTVAAGPGQTVQQVAAVNFKFADETSRRLLMRRGCSPGRRRRPQSLRPHSVS